MKPTPPRTEMVSEARSLQQQDSHGIGREAKNVHERPARTPQWQADIRRQAGGSSVHTRRAAEGTQGYPTLGRRYHLVAHAVASAAATFRARPLRWTWPRVVPLRRKDSGDVQMGSRNEGSALKGNKAQESIEKSGDGDITRGQRTRRWSKALRSREADWKQMCRPTTRRQRLR